MSQLTMSQLSLEPFAAKVYWRREGDGPDEIWPRLTRRFVESIAHNVRARKAVIGHIKGFASCGEGSLRVNCVSALLPVDVEGQLPPGTREMTLDLVVLAYSLAWNDAKSVVETALEQAGQAYHCRGNLQPSRLVHSHSSEHK